MLDNYEPPRKKRSLRSIAMTSWEGNAYMYNNARCVCVCLCAKHFSADSKTTPVRLANEAHHDMPPISLWKLWTGIPAPGYHFTTDLANARTQLLMSGRSPQVILRNAASADMVALRYQIVKGFDGGLRDMRDMRATP